MIYPRLLLSCVCIAVLACNNSKPKHTADSSAVPPTEDTLAQMPGGGPRAAVSTDEQLFETAYGSFKTAVEQNSEEQLKGLIHFPLQTSKEDLKAGGLSDADFHSRYKDIFTADVRNLVPKAGEGNVKEVDENNQEAYYTQLRRITDTGSALFEVKNDDVKNEFAFVFGRVQGTYKVIGFYSKWPVRQRTL